MTAINEFIDNEVKSNDVVLFMKGTPQFPQCGFSGQVVQILDYLGVPYKGINVLILREGAEDFFWKGDIQELDNQGVELDIHHIFPRAWCETKAIPPKIYDAIINKTPISFKANRMIGGDAPSAYLARLQNHEQVQLGDEAMNAILEGHRIPTAALRADDFEGFYQQRKRLLLEIIEKAMGKKPLSGADEGMED